MAHLPSVRTVLESEIVSSRPTRCMCNLPRKKKKEKKRKGITPDFILFFNSSSYKPHKTTPTFYNGLNLRPPSFQGEILLGYKGNSTNALKHIKLDKR
jgi:hypothetical protein